MAPEPKNKTGFKQGFGLLRDGRTQAVVHLPAPIHGRAAREAIDLFISTMNDERRATTTLLTSSVHFSINQQGATSHSFFGNIERLAIGYVLYHCARMSNRRSKEDYESEDDDNDSSSSR
jgi:hypothetical protein